MVRHVQVTAFARQVSEDEKGERLVRGKIVVRSDDTDLQGIADLMGRRIIAVNKASAAGFLYPASLLLAHGLNPMLGQVEIDFASGPHPQREVLGAVFTGEFDAAFIGEDALVVETPNIDTTQLRVLGTTHGYPGWVFAARQGLDEAIVTEVRDAMLRLEPNNPEHREILLSARIHRIVPSKDSDFNPVRSLEGRLGLAPLSHGVPRSRGTDVRRSR